MSLPKSAKPVDLKKIEATSRQLQHFLAALRGTGKDPWTSPFAASGGKVPNSAPTRRLG